MDNLTIYKDNYLVEASYKLSLIEQRLMLYCISKLNPLEPQQKQIIYINEFVKQFPDVLPNHAYSQIKEAIDNLAERWIKVKDPKYTEEFRWIQYKKYNNDQGSAVIEFSNAVMPYLCQLEQQFTKYQLRNVSGFKRTYSIRLYELLTQHRTFKKRNIEIAELRNHLCLEDKFPEWRELKRRVIDPAIEEINGKSDLIITYQPLRKQRSFVSIEFFISVNKQIELFEKKAFGKNQLKEIKQKLKKAE